MSGVPDVSVVVPTRNRGGVIADTVDAALAQHGVEVEVLVVDDGSTDDTWAWLSARASEPRLRPLRHTVNRGVAAARNTGVAAARGGCVAFLDDDDLWSPDKLATQLDAMTRVGADWSWTGVVLVDDRRVAVRDLPAPAPHGILHRLLVDPVSAIPAGASSVVARTDLVRRVGAFDVAFSQLADWDLWLRLADAAAGVSCDETLVAYVRHDDSMLLTDSAPLLEEYARLRVKHGATAAREGTAWDERRFARWVASGHRRAGRRVAAADVYLSSARRHRSAGDLVRAGAALLGERAWAPFNSARTDPDAVAPDWLRAYDR